MVKHASHIIPFFLFFLMFVSAVPATAGMEESQIPIYGLPLPEATVGQPYLHTLAIAYGWWGLTVETDAKWLQCEGYEGPHEYVLTGTPDSPGEFWVDFTVFNDETGEKYIAGAKLVVIEGSSELPAEIPSEIGPSDSGEHYQILGSGSGIDDYFLRPDADISTQWVTTGSNILWTKVYPEADTLVQKNQPTQNYGGNLELYVTGTGYPDYERFIFYRFNLQSIPAEANILEVHLNLYKSYDSGYNGYVRVMRGNESDWNEYTLTWNTRGPYMWNTSYNATGYIPGRIFEFVNSAGYPAWYNYTASALREAVDEMRENCGKAYLIFAANATGASVGYQSREATNKPYLAFRLGFPSYTHFTEVDEETSDGDATYIESGTNPVTDLFRMSNIEESGTPKSIDWVKMYIVARKITSATATLNWGIRIGSTDYQAASTVLTTSYAVYSYTWTSDPSTTGPWSLSTINDLATYATATNSNYIRVTQIYLVVQINWGWPPTFTSTPVSYAWVGMEYFYDVECNETVEFTAISIPEWSTFYEELGVLIGIPTEASQPYYSVSIRAYSVNGEQYAWQNWTLRVYGIVIPGEGFISTPPDDIAYVGDVWSYQVIVNATVGWGNLTLVYADWAVLDSQDILTGIPNEPGVYFISLKVTRELQSDYQNFTVMVREKYPTATVLTMSLILGFGLTGIGFVERRILFFAGICWLYIALAVLALYGVPWMVIGLGLGLALVVAGAFSIQGG